MSPWWPSATRRSHEQALTVANIESGHTSPAWVATRRTAGPVENERMTDEPDSGLLRRYGPPPVAVVTAAALGVGALWFALSVVTGLIFHFMPAAPILAAVWVRRAYGPDAPVPWPSLWAHIAGGLVVALVAGAAIASVGASLDSEWLVGAVLVIGTGLSIWLGRRGAG